MSRASDIATVPAAGTATVTTTAPFIPLSAARRIPRTSVALVLIAVLTALSVVAFPTPARAASQGAGFGTWAPMSPHGWHGSMMIDGVHTYCILPGAPAPTGPSVDRGVDGAAAGLSAQQLTGVNLLVTKYGQTGDPVQAAAVGWAVKALANWDETLHHFGYAGDSLAGAIDWTFSSLAPVHNADVQRLAVAYYDEARAASAGVVAASGTIVLTADAADYRHGSLRVDATTAAAGTITLGNATFVETGTSTLSNASTGVEYAIVAQAPQPGRPFEVSATGRFSVEQVAAVRYFTTDGGQDTAGPAGLLEFDVVGADTSPRVPQFAPTITTKVASAYAASGSAFVDDVQFAGSLEHWPRGDDDAHLTVTATAEVYRTDAAPAPTGGGVPPDATSVGSMAIETDPQTGPVDPYRVTSPWTLAEPGYYTAVWTIDAAQQSEEVAAALPVDYRWVEPFGETTQVVLVPAISSRAEPTVAAGRPASDTIIVEAPVPATGLVVSSSLFRTADGVAAAESCTEENLVWQSEPVTVAEAGEHTVTSPPIAETGIYYWQERAVDATGTVVHTGLCGVEHETTRVLDAPVAASTAPAALAATGAPLDSVRGTAGIAVLCATAGATLLLLRRRRYDAFAPIG